MVYFFRPSTEPQRIRWHWLTLIGPDAKDFLHRLSTLNVKSLAVGEGGPTCFLNAQGKIQAYCTLWNYDESSYAFEFDSGPLDTGKTGLTSWIDQFTFGEKMALFDPSEELECCWLFADEAADFPPELQALTALKTQATDEEIRLSHHGSATFGKIWITAWGRSSRLQQWIDRFDLQNPVSFEEIEKWRISQGSPRFACEITDQVSPLEVGLRSTIAEHKGCYPGQEVIERTIALGSPPRRLVQLTGEGECPQKGDVVFNLANPPAEIGLITSSTEWGTGYIALGLIKKIHAKENLPVQVRSKPGTIVRTF